MNPWIAGAWAISCAMQIWLLSALVRRDMLRAYPLLSLVLSVSLMNSAYIEWNYLEYGRAGYTAAWVQVQPLSSVLQALLVVEAVFLIGGHFPKGRWSALESSKERALVIPVLYLDLDGTVRKGFDELGKFVNGPSDVSVFPEALRAIRRFKKLGYRVVAITNQGGVALGHLQMDDMMAALVETQNQCANMFDLMMACRHHPSASDPLMAQCWCRKPRIGLVVEAAMTLSRKFHGMCPPSAALFVGDRKEDRECAENAGIKFMEAAEWRSRYGSKADPVDF